MSVTVQHIGGLCRIVVLGHLQTADDRQALIAALDTDPIATQNVPGVIELRFYDADTLPAEIIEAVCAHLDQGRSLKIFAYHALLARTLIRLGLPAKAVSASGPKKEAKACRALALGGSAQSLDKIIHIVSRLPLSETVVFVVQHILEDQPNLLDQLLKTQTDYRVIMPLHLMPVTAGTLYIAPPGHHMKVAHGHVYLTRDRLVQFARPSIDVLFESLAAEYGDAVMAVLLCGYGQDGGAGCAALKAAGASVLIEDGSDCGTARVMPDAAREAGVYDHVMKLPAIASMVATALMGEVTTLSGPPLELFLEALLGQYGCNFLGYQRDSLERRVKNLMTLSGIGRFCDFQQAVLSDPALFERLSADISVGVTSFFRHPEQFRLMRELVFPYLASFPVINIWSAGCSTGEEAYSLAILLDELGLLERSHLFATDINHYQLELAKSGLFPAETLAQSRENYLASGGTRCFDAYVQAGSRFLKVDERLRQQVLFYCHNLVDEGIFNEFQLIACRNVMIYFDHELQRKVLEYLARSLHVDGFLVLGPQDGLSLVAKEAGLEPYRPASHIYRRRRRHS